MDTSTFVLIADGVLFLHVMVVVFVVVGLILILIGGVLNWKWVRNPWLRLTHLICIAVVVMQAWAGVVCPLTTLEMWLRQQAGEVTYSGSFIAHWLDSILYYDLPAWIFTLIYTAFGSLVLLSWFWVKPRSLFSPKTVSSRQGNTI